QGEADQQQSGKDQGQIQAEVGQQNAGEHPQQGKNLSDLRSPQKHPFQPLYLQLVGDPRLIRTAQESVSHSPQHLGGQDGNKQGQHPLQQKTASNQQKSDRHGTFPAVQVGHNPRRYLKEENGQLQSKSDHQQLKGIHLNGPNVIDT